jgi:predicted signal transduction protein with EAL and GGDEF domain
MNILGETGLPPERLEIELTESALVRNLEADQEIPGGLREAGSRWITSAPATRAFTTCELSRWTIHHIPEFTAPEASVFVATARS